MGKKLSSYLQVGKTGEGKRRGKAGCNKIHQQAHVPDVIFNLHFVIVIVIVTVIVIFIIIVITLTAGMGLQGVGGGEGEDFLGREPHGRVLRQPFI